MLKKLKSRNSTIPSFTSGTEINYARYADQFIIGI